MMSRIKGPIRPKLLLLVLAVLVPALAVVGSSVAASRHSSSIPAAHVWITTADGTYKLTDMGTVPFTSAQSSAPTIVIDPSRSFQTMDGFGGAITDASAYVLYGMSSSGPATAMRAYVAGRQRQ